MFVVLRVHGTTWALDTYASIVVAVGTMLLAIVTAYMAVQTKKAVQEQIRMKCRELHTVELRRVIQGLISSLLNITHPDQIKFFSVISMEAEVKPNSILLVDLKNHLPHEQKGLFEELRHLEKEREKYVEQAHGLFKKFLKEAERRTGLIHDPGFGKDGSFSDSFVNSLYVDAFQLAKRQRPYYLKLDYELRPGGAIWLREYGIGILRAEDIKKREKGKKVYESMRHELESSEYVQDAKRLLEKQGELNNIREKLLNDLRTLVSIPLLPGDCRFIKYCMG